MKFTFKEEDYREILQTYLSKNTNYINNQEKENSYLIKRDSNLNESIDKNNNISKNSNEKEKINNIFSTNLISLLNNIPYLKKFPNFYTPSLSKNNKSVRDEGNSILNPPSNTNYNFFQRDKKSDKLLHINSEIYSKVILFSDKK
jgi:hypothetical protein